MILFKIARGWQTENFAWSRTIDTPEFHFAYAPLKNLPIAVALDVDDLGATFGIKVLSANFPITQIAISDGARAYHWEPLKGVVIDSTVTFRAQAKNGD